MRARSALLVVSLVAGGLAMTAAPAQGAFHLMKVREVYAGDALNPSAEFIELQMFQSGQNLVTGHSVVIYNGAGAPLQTITMNSNVANAQNQRTILIATSAAETVFMVDADFSMTAGIPEGAGKVCFDPEPNPIDCVAWGSYTGPTTNTGPPFGGGIPQGQSIERKINAGCATLLEGADDTNNSANDFQAVTPTAEPNSAAPNETACGGGGGGGGGGGSRATNIKAKVRGSRAIITGKIQPPAPGDKVSLTLSADGEKVGKKKDALDSQSQFKKALRVPPGSTRCKVTVRYEGDAVGKKKFAC